MAMTSNDFHDYRRSNDTKVDKLSRDLAAYTAEEQMRDEIMLEKVDKLTEKVTMLLAMWEQARGVVLFVKTAVAVVAVIAAAYAWLSTHITLK